MAKLITDTGRYTRKATGEVVTYPYQYPVFEASSPEASIQCAIDELGGQVVYTALIAQLKVTSNNKARVKAQEDNGDVVRRVLSEEEKAEQKTLRAKKQKALQALLASGKSIDDLLSELGLE